MLTHASIAVCDNLLALRLWVVPVSRRGLRRQRNQIQYLLNGSLNHFIWAQLMLRPSLF